MSIDKSEKCIVPLPANIIPSSEMIMSAYAPTHSGAFSGFVLLLDLTLNVQWQRQNVRGMRRGAEQKQWATASTDWCASENKYGSSSRWEQSPGDHHEQRHGGPSTDMFGLIHRCEKGPGRPLPAGETRKPLSLATKTRELRRRDLLVMTVGQASWGWWRRPCGSQRLTWAYPDRGHSEHVDQTLDFFYCKWHQNIVQEFHCVVPR